MLHLKYCLNQINVPYFDNIKNVLIKEFYNEDINNRCNEKIHNIKRKYDNKQITSIHLRRGDYLEYPNLHPICSYNYFKKCIDHFSNNIFLMFSDDITWCRNNLKFENVIYINASEFLCFTLMSKCDNNIISNSTYSWWAAYLNQNQNKQVFYPNIWFGKDGPQDVYDLTPKSWNSCDTTC